MIYTKLSWGHDKPMQDAMVFDHGKAFTRVWSLNSQELVVADVIPGFPARLLGG